MEQVKLPANGLLVLFKVIMKRLVLVFVSLVLMSLPVGADDFQDGINAANQEDHGTAFVKFFEAYKSVAAIMPKTYLVYSKEEKISYVRGQLDGEVNLMESMNHPDSDQLIDCANKKNTEIISQSLRLKNNLELNLPMAWNTQKLFGRFCGETNRKNKNLPYAHRTTHLDLINLIWDARGINKNDRSVYAGSVMRECMENKGWVFSSDGKKTLESDGKNELDEDTELCLEMDEKDFHEKHDQIHNAYFHGVIDGFIFILYNYYGIPNTMGYLRCVSDPEKLKKSIRAFKNFNNKGLHRDGGPVNTAMVAQSMVCGDL